jgi:hypothetical protein
MEHLCDAKLIIDNQDRCHFSFAWGAWCVEPRDPNSDTAAPSVRIFVCGAVSSIVIPVSVIVNQ